MTKYGTTIVQIGAKKEEAKGLTETDVTGAIIRDLKTNTRTVCFVSGTGEHQIEDSDRNGFSQLKDMLGKDNYATKSISLLTKAEVPSECTVLVVGGPQKDYQQPSVDAIKKYIEGGVLQWKGIRGGTREVTYRGEATFALETTLNPNAGGGTSSPANVRFVMA